MATEQPNLTNDSRKKYVLVYSVRRDGLDEHSLICDIRKIEGEKSESLEQKRVSLGNNTREGYYPDKCPPSAHPQKRNHAWSAL